LTGAQRLIPQSIDGSGQWHIRYTLGGVALGGVSWTNSAGVETFATGNASWTAAGGSITARYAVIYDVTTGDLLAYCLLDSTPADVTVTAGNTLTIQMAAAGVFTLQ
jgi:hypothetical protein